jgi:hypothetical protein
MTWRYGVDFNNGYRIGDYSIGVRTERHIPIQSCTIHHVNNSINPRCH